jgi:hypothetical protein
MYQISSSLIVIGEIVVKFNKIGKFAGDFCWIGNTSVVGIGVRLYDM